MTIASTLPSEYEGLRLDGKWTPRLPAEFLEQWAVERPDEICHEFVDFLADRHGLRRTYTWAQWDVWTRATAHRLQQLATREQRIAILAPQGPEYVVAFHAALRAGIVSVPLFAPDLPGHGDRLEAVLDDSRPTAVVTTSDKREMVEKVLVSRGMTDVAVLLVDELEGEAGAADAAAFVPPADLALEDLAYLQYTSGSTRAPAGVELSHLNLVYNMFQIIQAHQLDQFVPDATAVSWLPLFHDMGLLLGAGATAILGTKAVVFDPIAFVMKPTRWILEIGKHPHVLSAAPNFAYALGAKKIKDADLATMDYSSLEALVNGAEPVLPSVLDKFEAKFAPVGLRPTVQRPSYGLAEATLLVSVGDPANPRVEITADVAQLQQGILTPAEGDAKTTTLVSCGRPFGLHVVIADTETGAPVPDGHVGEIWVHGPNVGRGYFEKPEETAATFGGTFTAEQAGPLGVPEGPWLRTGDLGALHGRDLYITGRQKDLIIVDGRNVYPHDIEFSVEHADDDIALHRLAAFSIPSDDGEAVVVVAEQFRASQNAGARLKEIDAAARKSVSDQHQVGLAEFVLIQPDTIPWTSSGKIARQATRKAYLDGTLTRVTPPSA